MTNDTTLYYNHNQKVFKDKCRKVEFLLSLEAQNFKGRNLLCPMSHISCLMTHNPCLMSNVQSLRPFYSSQNPLNSSLTLKELLLVFFNIQYRALLSCNLNLVCIIYAPSDPEKNVSYCCPFTQKLHFFLGNLVDRPYQNDTFVTICNESLRTCSFCHTWGYIQDFSHNSSFPLLLSSRISSISLLKMKFFFKKIPLVIHQKLRL